MSINDSMTEVIRPATSFDGESHTYYDKDGNKLLGVSSISKIGEAMRAYDIGSKWGWKLGYQGAMDLIEREHGLDKFVVCTNVKGKTKSVIVEDDESLREAMIDRGQAPWSKRDQAADRGTWVHDILEALADGHKTDDAFWKMIHTLSIERRGHANALLKWYLDFRPSFVATEVQVTSEQHGFAGRYDIRCLISDQALHANGIKSPPTFYGPLLALCLVDLKTSKGIYPLSHYAQLEGYELASTEMGFPPTDMRCVLNTHPDGTYDVGVSHARPETFLAYLTAYREIKWMEANDPAELAKRELEDKLLTMLPTTSRNLAGRPGFPETAQEIGRVFGRLRKRGLVDQGTDYVWFRVDGAAANT